MLRQTVALTPLVRRGSGLSISKNRNGAAAILDFI
jgi:hypothetical protein